LHPADHIKKKVISRKGEGTESVRRGTLLARGS